MGIIFGHVGAFFGPSLPRNHLRTDLSSKKYVLRNLTFSIGFGRKLTPRWDQNRPKIAPRRVQDRLGSLFYLEFSLRLLIVLGSALVPFWLLKWSPGGRLSCANRLLGGPRRSWDRLGSFFFRLAIRDHFLGPLGCLLESFWSIFGLVLDHLGLFWARFWALRVAFWNPLTLYAHQLINASTLQPVARQHLETRAGGLRAERLNKIGD